MENIQLEIDNFRRAFETTAPRGAVGQLGEELDGIKYVKTQAEPAEILDYLGETGFDISEGWTVYEYADTGTIFTDPITRDDGLVVHISEELNGLKFVHFSVGMITEEGVPEENPRNDLHTISEMLRKAADATRTKFTSVKTRNPQLASVLDEYWHRLNHLAIQSHLNRHDRFLNEFKSDTDSQMVNILKTELDDDDFNILNKELTALGLPL